MRFQHIIEQVYFHPWAITPEGFAAVSRIVSSHLVRADGFSMADFINPRKPMSVQNGKATIDVCGVLGSGMSPIEKTCGNTDYGDIESEIRQAVAMGAKAFDFTFDSPGGMCSGNIECGRIISQLPNSTARIGSQCCSAAYLLASGCKNIVCSSSSMVGSIGCIIARVDSSAAWEAQGIKPDFITNEGGDLKSTGYGPSLSDSQRDYLQQTVDDMFSQFREHVLQHRAVDPGAMRGQSLVGPRAKQMNLVDEVS